MNGALDPLQPPVLQLPGAAALPHPRSARRVALNEGWADSDSRKQDPVPKCHLAKDTTFSSGGTAQDPRLQSRNPLSKDQPTSITQDDDDDSGSAGQRHSGSSFLSHVWWAVLRQSRCHSAEPRQGVYLQGNLLRK